MQQEKVEALITTDPFYIHIQNDSPHKTLCLRHQKAVCFLATDITPCPNDLPTDNPFLLRTCGPKIVCQVFLLIAFKCELLLHYIHLVAIENYVMFNYNLGLPPKIHVKFFPFLTGDEIIQNLWILISKPWLRLEIAV